MKWLQRLNLEINHVFSLKVVGIRQLPDDPVRPRSCHTHLLVFVKKERQEQDSEQDHTFDSVRQFNIFSYSIYTVE